MSLKQQKNMLVSKIQNVFASIVKIFVVLLSKSISAAIHILKIVISQFGKAIILIFIGLFLSILLHSLLQAIAQVITNYQYSFPSSKDATTIATSIITVGISTVVVISVALFNVIQSRDYSLKNKDKISVVYDKLWKLLANSRPMSKPYMSFEDSLALYNDFTRRIMGAGSWKLRKKWLNIEQVFEKFFSTQETLNDSERNQLYDCIELMDKQINGFTSSSLRKNIIDKFLK